MKIKISRHIFGSIDRYTTLAKSKDIASNECQQLETFAYGQTNNTAYLRSLKTKPAYVCRRLRSGRWGITRFFQGKPDTCNRITLSFITAILGERDWLFALGCDINPIIFCKDLWQWDGNNDLPQLTVDLPSGKETPSPKIREKTISLLSAIESQKGLTDTTILVKESEYDREVLRWLHMTLPQNEKRRFSYAVRSLTDGLPLTIISIADVGSYGKSSRRVVRYSGTQLADEAPYAETLNEMWKPGQQFPGEFVAACESFPAFQEQEDEPTYVHSSTGRNDRATYDYRREFSPPARLPVHFKWWATLAAALLVVLIIVGINLFNRMQRTQRSDELIYKANSFLEKHEQGSDWISKDIENTIAKGKKLESEVLAQRGKGKVWDQLTEWLEYADNAKQEFKTLMSQLSAYDSLRLTKKPLVYPPNKQLEKVLKVYKALVSSQARAEGLGPSYLDQVRTALGKIEAWKDTIAKLLDSVKKDAETSIREAVEEPNSYDDKNVRLYKSNLQKLEKQLENLTLVNALASPITRHKKRAEKLRQDLKNAISKSKVSIEKVIQYKKEAESYCSEVSRLLSDPNKYSNIIIAENKLREAEKVYPKYVRIKELKREIDRLKKDQKNIEDFLNKAEKLLDAPEKIYDICLAMHHLDRVKKLNPNEKLLPSLQLKAISKFKELEKRTLPEQSGNLLRLLKRENFDYRDFEDVRNNSIRRLKKMVDKYRNR